MTISNKLSALFNSVGTNVEIGRGLFGFGHSKGWLKIDYDPDFWQVTCTSHENAHDLTLGNAVRVIFNKGTGRPEYPQQLLLPNDVALNFGSDLAHIELQIIGDVTDKIDTAYAYHCTA